VKTPTIYDIKRDTAQHSPHFFDGGTLRFFDQQMKDFRVLKSPQGNLYILATSDRWHGSTGQFTTFRQYIPGDKEGEGRLVTVDNGDTPPEEYIQTH